MLAKIAPLAPMELQLGKPLRALVALHALPTHMSAHQVLLCVWHVFTTVVLFLPMYLVVYPRHPVSRVPFVLQEVTFQEAVMDTRRLTRPSVVHVHLATGPRPLATHVLWFVQVVCMHWLLDRPLCLLHVNIVQVESMGLLQGLLR